MRTYRAGAVDNARPEPSALRSTSGRCGSHRRAARAARVYGGTEGVKLTQGWAQPLNSPGAGGVQAAAVAAKAGAAV